MSNDHSSDYDKQTPRGDRIPTLTDLVDFDSATPMQKTPRISSWDELTSEGSEYINTHPTRQSVTTGTAADELDEVNHEEHRSEGNLVDKSRSMPGYVQEAIDNPPVTDSPKLLIEEPTRRGNDTPTADRPNSPPPENNGDDLSGIEATSLSERSGFEVCQGPETQTDSDQYNLDESGGVADAPELATNKLAGDGTSGEVTSTLDFSAYDIVEELAKLTDDADSEKQAASQPKPGPETINTARIDEEQIEQLADRILDTLAPIFREAIASALQEILSSPHKG